MLWIIKYESLIKNITEANTYMKIRHINKVYGSKVKKWTKMKSWAFPDIRAVYIGYWQNYRYYIDKSI